MLKNIFAVLFSLLFCTGATAHDKKLHVVASFSILGDIVREIAGDNVELRVLVGADSDAHMYQPTPDDVKAIAEADIVVINGLGFEGWMDRLIESSGFKGAQLIASKDCIKLQINDEAEDHHGHAHEHAQHDPHAWQNASNASCYATNIRDALIQKDASSAELYKAHSEKYLSKLTALDNWIKEEISKVPEEKRKVITSHDAFQYYAKAYGVAFLAPLGMNTESEPSAGELAKLIDQIRSARVTALFVENISDTRLIEQLEKDGGARMGGTLYSDALSNEKGAAPTYIEMMKHNTSQLVNAMRNNP